MTDTNKVTSLKDALLDSLLDQIEHGPVVTTDEGETLRISPSPALLNVAARVVKDFAHEMEVTKKNEAEVERLERFAAQRREMRVVK